MTELSPERMEQLRTALRQDPRVENVAPLVAGWVVVPEEVIAVNNRVIEERNELRGRIAAVRALVGKVHRSWGGAAMVVRDNVRHALGEDVVKPCCQWHLVEGCSYDPCCRDCPDYGGTQKKT